MVDEQKKQELVQTARALMASGKGLLAADESAATVEKRFKPINLESTEDNRRAFRELFLTAPGVANYISGVILFDETIRQHASTGESFVSVLQREGVVPGIKVDLGTEPDPDSPNEKLTKGLDTLRERVREYVNLGAKFAKWRAVITIADGLPTEANVQKNVETLAKYAKICQEEGLVPIVEPEVLMDGAHNLERCEHVTTQVQQELFKALEAEEVFLPGLILKSNMVIEGKESQAEIAAAEVAEHTIQTFKKTVPENIGGIVFLSGGQTEQRATENLNEINKVKGLPWTLTFSYARALQDSATKFWAGKPENFAEAQKVFMHRAKMNSLAQKGEYAKDLEMAGVEDFGGNQASQD